MNTKLRDGIHWVGYVDWTVRVFHGYRTERGTSYNAYLVQDEKTALIDTVKAPYGEALKRHIQVHTPLNSIDYLVCNHAEPDHSGSLVMLADACPTATIVCNAKCKKALQQHYTLADERFTVVADGDTISLGKKTLVFADTPMVHWPESMATYCPEEKLLFSMDAFGQHYASSPRFDDETDFEHVMDEAKTYYANIVMPYGKQTAKAIAKLAALDIEMIAPSHGIIWRSHIPAILNAYQDWVTCRPVPKVLVIYDTMWQSTACMARHIAHGALQVPDVDVRIFDLNATNRTVLATEVLDAAAIAFGSATLNRVILPDMAALLIYLVGLRPAGKAGLAFGSYGWAKGGQKEVHDLMVRAGIEPLRDPIHSQFVPTDDVRAECEAAGKLLAERAHSVATT